jgi:ATP-dependent DNA helicase RecQ
MEEVKSGTAEESEPLAVVGAIHDAREALRQYFGFREFLDGQELVMSSILGGGIPW